MIYIIFYVKPRFRDYLLVFQPSKFKYPQGRHDRQKQKLSLKGPNLWYIFMDFNLLI